MSIGRLVCAGVAMAVTVGLVAPVAEIRQAASVGRPRGLPDRYLIDRQCGKIDDLVAGLDPGDPTSVLTTPATTACQRYRAEVISRDEWVQEMLAVQDELPPSLRERFIPEFSDTLPVGLDSYSLLLLPDTRWRGDELATELQQIWSAFSEFGFSIGDRHVALWFLDLDGNVDVDRARWYCDRIGLDYNDGPYVVTSATRPDQLEDREELVVIELDNIEPWRIPSILNLLAEDLRNNRDIRSGRLLWEEVKQTMLTLVVRHGPDVGRLKSFLSLVGL